MTLGITGARIDYEPVPRKGRVVMPSGGEMRAALIGAGLTVVLGLGGWALAGTSEAKSEIKRVDGRIDTVKTEQDTRWEDVLRRLERIEAKIDNRQARR